MVTLFNHSSNQQCNNLATYLSRFYNTFLTLLFQLMDFKLKTQLKPTSNQLQAVKKLTEGITSGARHQVLLGVTGSGKTFTMAQVIQNIQRPTLVISHNKTLAAQLYQEFKEFFPENTVNYFVSYYDYYQPEAYIPQTETYIEKDAKINEEIDRLRHAATQNVLSRKDTIVVASVSCIYGMGDPKEYEKIALDIKTGQKITRKDFIKHLVELQYERNDILPYPGTFRVRGENMEIYPVTGEKITQIIFLGDEIERITYHQLPIADKTVLAEKIKVFPAKHFVTPQYKLEIAIKNIETELEEHLKKLRKQKKYLEAQRLEARTNFDLEMLRETGYCAGIENYSRHLSFREPGEPPYTLLDYFQQGSTKSEILNPKHDDFLLFIDESHMSIPQIHGMYNGDKARKEILVEHGFRLPSALDNRPLKFKEFEKKIGQTIYASATPGPYETKRAKRKIIEQLTRPTGILDPTIEIHPTEKQIPNLIGRVKERVSRKERVLVTALTKRLSEDLTEYLHGEGINVQYLHSEIKTLERPEILRDLRLGKHDVVVGVNLLREGIDLPEVSLVVILDADKEGFLRNRTALIQTMGRAARHTKGHIVMYADTVTKSMRLAIEETKRRRKIQEAYNKKYGITPKPIKKEIRDLLIAKKEEGLKDNFEKMTLNELQKEMKTAANNLEFERAAKIRERIKILMSK